MELLRIIFGPPSNTHPFYAQPTTTGLEASELISYNPLPGGFQIRFCQQDAFSHNLENRQNMSWTGTWASADLRFSAAVDIAIITGFYDSCYDHHQ